MKLHFMKDDAVTYFKNNVSVFLDKYIDSDYKWTKEKYSIYKGKECSPFEEFKLEVPDFKLDMASDKPESTDIENVKRIYLALKNLSDTQATDERFWVGLAHNEFWDYMKYRLRLTPESISESKIKANFFFNYSQKRSIQVHTLARLWWVGRLIYDETNKDHFEGINALRVDFAGRVLTLFSNNYTNNPKVTRALLKAIIRIENTGEVINRLKFREILRYVNVLGGIIILDYLSEEDIIEKIVKHYCEIYAIDESVQEDILKQEKNKLINHSNIKSEETIIEDFNKNEDKDSYELIMNDNSMKNETGEINIKDETTHYINKDNSVTEHSNNSSNTLENYLESKGIKFNDNRSSNGKLWIKKSKNNVFNVLECEELFGIRFTEKGSFWVLE